MVKRRREFGMLFAGVITLIVGVLGLRRGGYNYFGVTEITGAQAQLFAWVMLVFGILLLFLHFRGTKPQS